MEHNIESLPKWAQSIIGNLRWTIERDNRRMDRLEKASAVLDCRDWFTVQGPRPGSGMPEVYHLWFLYPDGAHAACSLGPEDVLLVGRRRK